MSPEWYRLTDEAIGGPEAYEATKGAPEPSTVDVIERWYNYGITARMRPSDSIHRHTWAGPVFSPPAVP